MSNFKYKRETKKNLYEIRNYLRETTRQELGVYLENVLAYVQDPLVGLALDEAGVRPFQVEWEPGLADGPTSARLAVVDYNADTNLLVSPAKWDQKKLKYFGPEGEILDGDHRNLFQFHQVNVWTIVQSVLDLFEGLWALGRPVPWGVNGGRLIIVPHAGYGENAFYDRRSKALQFYYYGDPKSPKYTCLSHDIVAHETGHAILDGIRPYYFQFTSPETAAFHEFVADLTAILAALRNNYVRLAVGDKTDGDLSKDNIIACLAEEFGAHLKGQEQDKYTGNISGIARLRDANNRLMMTDIKDSDSPHRRSLVLTGAVYDLLKAVSREYKESNRKNLWSATVRLIRMALQPLDFCPPVDIRFIDYARAMLRNFELYEPQDSPRREAYTQFIRQIFSDRGICDSKELGMLRTPGSWDVYHPVDAIADSRTGAYYFLNDNRKALRIPWNQDLSVVDLYVTNKQGRAGSRLPREIVLEYIWSEQFRLDEDCFGPLKGQAAELLCGGTLVLDDRGNVLSWQHKPGLQVDKDLEEGKKRMAQLRDHIARQVQRGLVGLRGDREVEIPGKWTPPVTADISSGVLRLEIAPHMRNFFAYSAREDTGLSTQKDLDDWGENKWTIKF